MKRFSKISIDDIKNIQIDSGVLLKEFDVENPVFLPENVICATNGGINPVCEPEYYDFGEDVDNAKSAKETKRIRGWNVSINFTTFTTSLALIRLALGVADISGKMLNIRQKLQYSKDFKDIWWVGKRADDKLLAIRLIRSLSDSGFSLQTRKGGKGQTSVTLKGHSSFAEPNKIPIEVYVIGEFNDPVVPEANSYLTFASAEPFTLSKNNTTKYWDGSLYYSNDTETWNEWDAATVIASAEHGGEQRIYMRGIGNTTISTSGYGFWKLNGNEVHCNGNIENLLDYEIVARGEHPPMKDGQVFGFLFRGCTALVSAPELPAPTVPDSGYTYMFQDCSNLRKAPALPAKILGRQSYMCMFSDCTSLTTIPALPALVLPSACYRQMFYNCPNIKLSTTHSEEYHTAYRIPYDGSGTVESSSQMHSMFSGTGGTFTDDPEINTTYYTSNEVI